MKYGKFLQKKGMIGFVAPSFGCNIDPYKSAFENALRRWKQQGYGLDLGPNCFEGSGVGISNTPELCGQELTEFYLKADNDCLIACGGGELMCEVLDYVDWEKIAAAPAKWYMGFSDNTNMTYLLATICDTASIYGPCAPSFGMKPQHRVLKDAFAILTGEGAAEHADGICGARDYADHSKDGGNSCAPGKMEGEGIGDAAGTSYRTKKPIPKFCVHGYPKWEIEGIKDEENPLAAYNLTERKILKLYDGTAVNDQSLSNAGAAVSDLPLREYSAVGSDAMLCSAASPGGNCTEGSGRKERNSGYPILTGKEIPETAFEGRLLGGCLDCLVNLLGTCYDHTDEFLEKYKEDGVIWFLDACDLNVFGIRRAMWQMEHAGWFRYVKGFLIGRPLSALEPVMGLDQYQAVLDVAGRKGVPVVMDMDLGHLPPSMPLITGSYAAVHVQGNDIRVEMELRP
ncbi:MAG: LD-carboxypeptidase [Lachnospiraceae bacterium]|nr:LD-carboxypeptidase [Lachnospiraceae bacterium]